MDPITLANATSTSLSGTGEPGAIIALVVSDGTHANPAVFVLVPASGPWTVNGLNVSMLDDGPITYAVTAINAAGKSTQVLRTVTKNTAAAV